MRYSTEKEYDAACREALDNCKEMLKGKTISSFKIVMEYPNIDVDVEYPRPVDWILVDWAAIT